jgi:hypothetical protein
MLRRVEPTPAGCAQLFGALFDNTASGFCVQLDFSRNNLSRASKVCHLLINYSSDPTTVFSIILLWFSCLCSSVEPTPLASLSLSLCPQSTYTSNFTTNATPVSSFNSGCKPH